MWPLKEEEEKKSFLTSYNLCNAIPFLGLEITVCVIRNCYWMRRFPSKVQIVCRVVRFPRKIGSRTLTYVCFLQPWYSFSNPCRHGVGGNHVQHELIQNLRRVARMCKHGKVDQNSAPVYQNHVFVRGRKVVAKCCWYWILFFMMTSIVVWNVE